MNGNDYLVVEERHTQEIFDAYVKQITYDDIPDDFKIKWIRAHLEGE